MNASIRRSSDTVRVSRGRVGTYLEAGATPCPRLFDLTHTPFIFMIWFRTTRQVPCEPTAEQCPYRSAAASTVGTCLNMIDGMHVVRDRFPCPGDASQAAVCSEALSDTSCLGSTPADPYRSTYSSVDIIWSTPYYEYISLSLASLVYCIRIRMMAEGIF
jgi:hypothetical protein